MGKILTILKKELKGSFDNPTGYIILAVFLLFWEYLFFRSYFLVGEASMRGMFELLPWLFMVVIPAITMRSISREREEATIEWLLTHPVKEMELIVAKFLSGMVFVIIALLLTLPIPLSSSLFGRFDYGILLSQYLSALFIGCVFVSLGISISSLFKSSVSSLLVSIVLSFFLVVSGAQFVTDTLPLSISSILEGLSVLTHYNSMARGVIDLRDLLYFLTTTSVFLSLTYLTLIRDKLGNLKPLYRRFQIGVGLIVIIAVLTGIAGSRIPGRLDLTEDGRYTLSEGTRKVLDSLNDIVNITLFASKRLPAQLKPRLRDIQDTLRDYETLGKGNVLVSYKYPDSDSDARNEAALLGISTIQFNLIGNEEFKVTNGYLGIAVEYGGTHEVIPYVQDTSDLEYQLTSFIKKLTTKKKKKVIFLSGHGEKSIYRDYRNLRRELERQFEVSEFGITDKQKEIPDDTSVLVIAGPNDKMDEKTKDAINGYIKKGGSAFFMIDTVVIDPALLIVTKNPNSFKEFLKPYGIEVMDDVVYDIRANENVRFGGGNITYILPYPFWIRAIRAENRSPVTAGIESILLPWASSIRILTKDKKADVSIERLLSTTRTGGREVDHFNVMPNQRLRPKLDELGEQLLAVAIRWTPSKGNKKTSRMIVMGDSDFLNDQITTNAIENISFAINAIDWLAQEDMIAGIKAKGLRQRRLYFTSPVQMSMIKFGNYGFIVLVILVSAIVRLLRRRAMMRRVYRG